MSSTNKKVVVITGGLGLLGRAFSVTVAKAGYHVIMIDRQPEDHVQKEVKALSEKANAPIHYIECDITNLTSVQLLISDIHKKTGRIDALVNNAYPRNAAFGKSFEEVTYDDFCENLGMNLGGYFLCSQQFLHYFKKQGHGNIINIASIYGVVPPRFEIYEGSDFTMPVEYAVIKAGVVHLSKYITRYFKGMNIRCNTISPGGVLNGHSDLFQEKYKQYATNKGMLDPDDLCGALLFLLSEESAMVNGQNLVVDDGWVL